jgi:hypothetical protein
MKTAVLFLLFGLLLLVVFLIRTTVAVRKNGLDLHVGATYYVVGYSFLSGIVLLIVGTFFVTGAVFGTGFRSIFFLGILFAVAVIWFLVIRRLRQKQKQWTDAP